MRLSRALALRRCFSTTALEAWKQNPALAAEWSAMSDAAQTNWFENAVAESGELEEDTPAWDATAVPAGVPHTTPEVANPPS